MTAQISSERLKSNRGFASMDRGKQREVASKGGKAAHVQGRAHEFTADEARTAGRKGGEVVSRDRDHMVAIGRSGGQARGRNRALQATRATPAHAETSTSTGSGGALTSGE
jgi:general stress protein YciG